MTSDPPSAVNTSSFRLLILAPSSPSPSSIPPFPAILEAITGAKPSDEISSFAGYTSHPPLRLKTKYYTSDVSIWCDELPVTSKPEVRGRSTSEGPGPAETGSDAKEATAGDLESSTLEEWKDQMLSPEAAEVRAVIGGIVLILPVFSLSSSSIPEAYIPLVEAVHALREAVEDESYGRDVASAVVVQSMSPTVKHDKLLEATESFEDVCLSDRGILGWDFVTWNGEVRDEVAGEDIKNEYGERLGIQRIIQVLEGIDWSASAGLETGEDDFNFDDPDEEDASSSAASTHLFGRARFSGLDFELQREMMELKMSMLQEEEEDKGEHEDAGAPQESRSPGAEDDDDQVEQLQVLMERVVAIREAGAEMPKEERERFAKREIGRIMREMG